MFSGSLLPLTFVLRVLNDSASLSPSIYPLLIEPGSGAEGPVWPAVLSNLASRRDQRLATFHPKCPLPPSFLHPSLSLSLFLPLSSTLPGLGLTLHSSCTNAIPTILLSLSLSLLLHSNHTCTPHISNYMACLNNALYITPSLILFTLSPFHPSISLIRPKICSSSTHSSSSAMNPPFPHSLHTAS